MDSIIEIVNNVETINVYSDGEIYSFSSEKDYYDDICNELKVLIENSNEMPALGVALHNEIIKELGKGLWLEMCFHETFFHNEMPFERLLIHVSKDFTGFNIIRYYDGKYDGRCYYINLIDKDMSSLYQSLENIIKYLF